MNLRTLSTLGLLAAALAASAQTVAYTSLGYPPSTGGATTVGDTFTNVPASLFTAGASGPLSAFQVLVDNSDTVPVSFNARLYGNAAPTATSPMGTVGTLLGSFTGTIPFFGSNAYGLVTVPATGVSIVSGTSYWLELSGGSVDAKGLPNQAWQQQGAAPKTTIRIQGTYYPNSNPEGFTVLVASANPTPEPSALAALGLGAVALVKRRKRA